MNNALLLLLSCGLIGMVSAVIHSGRERHRRQESADTPPRSRAISTSPSQTIRPAKLQAAAAPTAEWGANCIGIAIQRR